MARVLVIPDVHGSKEWEVVKTLPKDSYDYIVFLGDYFDSWENEWPSQGENFLNICVFVSQDPEHRKMLIGNHDWSYVTGTRYGSEVSGHQNGKVAQIRQLLSENSDIIDLAFEVDGCVFSHAGFTKTWVDDYLIPFFHREFDEWEDVDTHKPGKVWDEKNFSIKFLNDYWHGLSHNPGDENFRYEMDELLDWHGCFSGSGDEVMQGPLWVRPTSLLKDAYFKKQIVGHTELAFIEPVSLALGDNYITVCDSPSHMVYGVIDTGHLPTPKTIQEFNKWMKEFEKAILDFKSEQGSKMDYTKEMIMPKIIERFGSNVAELIYNTYFKE